MHESPETISLQHAPPLDVNPESIIWHKGKSGRVVNGVDLRRVRIRYDDTAVDASVIVPIAELEPTSPDLALYEENKASRKVAKDIQRAEKPDWEVAQRRLQCIEPLLDPVRPMRRADLTKQMVVDRAKEFHTSKSSVYAWIDLYLEANRRLSALIPARSKGGEGQLRIHDLAKEHLENGVQKFLHGVDESGQLYTIPDIIDMVRSDCAREINHLTSLGKLPPKYVIPSANTIRNRIVSIDKRVVEMARYPSTKHKYAMEKGSHTDTVEYPLMVVQIDHTKLDVHLVDSSEERNYIGRPYLTIAIDVFSRVITGFYISLDPVGGLAVGMCISNSILSKDKWLLKHGITVPWEVAGPPDVFHFDNAKEFSAEALVRACVNNHTGFEFRPLGQCHFGGTVESMMGHFGKKMKGLPGASFSNIAERKDYNSKEWARMTLDELEAWLIRFVCIYHLKKHSSLGMSPMEKFEKGIMGSGSKPGRGYPKVPKDADRVRIDFLPGETRSVQGYGIRFNNIEYRHDVLKTLVKTDGHFIRYDPRDISTIYFLDEQAGVYYAIPYADRSHPPVSIWEVRAAKALAKQRRIPVEKRNEQLIFQLIDEQREIVAKSIKLTTTAQRDLERQRQNAKAVKLTNPPEATEEDEEDSAFFTDSTPAPQLPYTPDPNKVYTPFEDE